MSAYTEVVLVDGVGRSRLHTVPDALVPRNVIPWPHPQRARNERQVICHFDRSKEVDPDGRTVYRQRGTGDPAIRWDYLKLTPIVQGPRLRLEGPCNGE
jgi:hypothetical protein